MGHNKLLRELEYCPVDPEYPDGCFWWKVPNKRKIPIGGVVKHFLDRGYHKLKLYGKLYRGHWLAWFYVHGEWPRGQIDHLGGNRACIDVRRLRVVSGHENSKNQKINNENTSGVVGVCWHKHMKRWHAFIWVGRRKIHLGYFRAKSRAVRARREAEITYGFHPGHGLEADVREMLYG